MLKQKKNKTTKEDVDQFLKENKKKKKTRRRK